MPLAAWPEDALLQRIAAENNLAETAFLVAAEDDEVEFELRWFTPMVEVALCGHATLASGHVVLSSDTALDRVRFRTRKAGVLEVARSDDGYLMALPAYRAVPRPLPAILAALGLARAEATLWHEGGYGLVVVADAAAVRALDPDFRALAKAGDVLTIVTAPGDAPGMAAGVGNDVISRVFAPGAGIDEDPVTGSAHAVLTPYWAERLDRDRFTALQASARGGRLTCRLDGERVMLGGRCVTVIEGTFLL